MVAAMAGPITLSEYPHGELALGLFCVNLDTGLGSKNCGGELRLLRVSCFCCFVQKRRKHEHHSISAPRRTWSSVRGAPPRPRLAIAFRRLCCLGGKSRKLGAEEAREWHSEVDRLAPCRRDRFSSNSKEAPFHKFVSCFPDDGRTLQT